MTKLTYESTAVIGDQGSGGWVLNHPVGFHIVSIDGQSKLSVNEPCNGLTYELQAAGLQPSVWVI
ncbi:MULTISPECIES: hypothetical protein, partial [unclassified Rathayibacter]|uniref:hypothetical protein n=1 Tax=unclassified Rathayibacter TaxID=2609250 RepID=UPI00104627C6